MLPTQRNAPFWLRIKSAELSSFFAPWVLASPSSARIGWRGLKPAADSLVSSLQIFIKSYVCVIDEKMHLQLDLDPWDHLLKDAEGETKWNFNLGDSLEEASQQSMLEEYVFTVSAAVRPEPDEMAGTFSYTIAEIQYFFLFTILFFFILDIISSCKGQCVKEFIGDPAPGEKRIAISAETSEDKRRWRIWAARKAVIVKAEAILSGVLRQKFEPDNFKLG